jgi:RNA polymerase sigma-70 factor (ECF subfamily)
MAQDIEDNALVRLFKEDKQRDQAFTAIVKKYQERIYWQIRRMVVSHQDADDVMQNVFIKAWKGLESFREDSQLFTWLYRIALKNKKELRLYHLMT